jgi:hypothetical protein
MTDEQRRSEDDRAVERGDAAEADAPTSAEQNEGMSTILGAEPVDGVQDNEEES